MDGDKRLDFDAPLLSVRRPASEPEPNPNPTRSALPFYKPDLKSGPVRNPGVVPFRWEQSPGHPKDRPRSVRTVVAPKLPPGRILVDKEPANPLEDEKEAFSIEGESSKPLEDEDEKFCDAVETLSLTESSFVNCSVSGLSEMPEASGSFSTDPQVRDFMMGRFLPAAKAMAADAPHASSRKPTPTPNGDRNRVIIQNGDQNRVRFPNGAEFIEEDEDDEDEEEEEEYYGNGNLLLKGCGLIPRFCLKGSLCLLNPVTGMKVSGRRLPPSSVRGNYVPQFKAMEHESLGQFEEEYSWEAVYKHKLLHGHSHIPEEDVSKLTSESNQFTYWSDSLTTDGSSPRLRSHASGVSPYRNEPSQSPFHEGKGFLGVPRRDKKCFKTGGSNSFEKDSMSLYGSGAISPSVERTCQFDSRSKSSSLRNSSDIKDRTKPDDEDSQVGIQSRRMDEILVLETRDKYEDNNGSKSSDRDDRQMLLRENNQVKNDPDPMPSLLSLPLPNSPSESWLSRTLPSVSSKNPSPQSFLGIHAQPRKQASILSSTVPKKDLSIKSSELKCGQTRFADMLSMPLSPNQRFEMAGDSSY